MNGKAQPKRLTVSILQPDAAPGDPARRLQELEAAVGEAKSSDADILVCPELFASGYHSSPHSRECAERSNGRFYKAVSRLARRERIAIAYGYPEQAGQTIFNSAFVIGPDGGTLQHHRKCHLPVGFEQEVFSTANRLGRFSLNGIACSCIICYDVEFPEVVRLLAQAGVELLIVPTALTANWGIVIDKMIPTRAFENGIFLAYSNYAGFSGERTFAGRSCLIGPNGEEILRGGRHAGVLTASIDCSMGLEGMRLLKYLDHLRSDIVLDDD